MKRPRSNCYKNLKEKPLNFPIDKLVKNKKIAIIIPRMVVANVGSIDFNPSLLKIATNAAVNAERSA